MRAMSSGLPALALHWIQTHHVRRAPGLDKYGLEGVHGDAVVGAVARRVRVVVAVPVRAIAPVDAQCVTSHQRRQIVPSAEQAPLIFRTRPSPAQAGAARHSWAHKKIVATPRNGPLCMHTGGMAPHNEADRHETVRCRARTGLTKRSRMLVRRFPATLIELA